MIKQIFKNFKRIVQLKIYLHSLGRIHYNIICKGTNFYTKESLIETYPFLIKEIECKLSELRTLTNSNKPIFKKNNEPIQ